MRVVVVLVVVLVLVLVLEVVVGWWWLGGGVWPCQLECDGYSFRRLSSPCWSLVRSG